MTCFYLKGKLWDVHTPSNLLLFCFNTFIQHFEPAMCWFSIKYEKKMVFQKVNKCLFIRIPGWCCCFHFMSYVVFVLNKKKKQCVDFQSYIKKIVFPERYFLLIRIRGWFCCSLLRLFWCSSWTKPKTRKTGVLIYLRLITGFGLCTLCIYSYLFLKPQSEGSVDLLIGTLQHQSLLYSSSPG